MRLPRFRSLRMRITVLLLGVQVICALLMIFLHPFLVPDTSYLDIADITSETLIKKSLTRTTSGELRLTPTPALRRYAASRPGFAYAVSDEKGRIALGSDVYLGELLRQVAPVQPEVDDGFTTTRQGRGAINIDTLSTQFGKIGIAIAGEAFGIADLPSFFVLFRPLMLEIYSPLLVGAIISLPLLIVWALRPLGLVKRAAASIDIRTIDQPLPTDKLPDELLPAVEAINAALARIAIGWQQQHFFMANAAHELRTPVAILQARLDMTRLDSASRQELGRDVHRLRLLVDQLLTIARLNRQHDASFTPLDLVDLLQEVVADCAPYVIRGGRSIDFQSTIRRCDFMGDRQALASLTTNLIDNAAKVEPEGGSIIVRLQSAHTGVVLTVADHGRGIDAEDRDHVFEPFWRKDPHFPGTGLGLAAAKEIVTLHGGSIGIDDTAGGGATIRVELPRPQQEETL